MHAKCDKVHLNYKHDTYVNMSAGTVMSLTSTLNLVFCKF